MNDEMLTAEGGMRRRQFIGTLAGFGTTTLAMGAMPVFSYDNGKAAALTVQEIIDRILARIPGAPFAQTVDTLKAGTGEQQVKGIVTTMFATVDVIKRCAVLDANFIIAHEPTFYNHLDETGWLADDKVYRYKADLLQQHGIAVWRFHDYIHAHRPDGVRMGVLAKLGWEKFYVAGSPVVTIPETTLEGLVQHAKSALGITQARVMGEPGKVCKRIAIMPGASGGRSHLAVLDRERPDAFLCGEVNEWETTEYIRDARSMGESVSLIVLGHALSEEPGMEWLVPWLQPMVNGIKVIHIASGDPYSTVLG